MAEKDGAVLGFSALLGMMLVGFVTFLGPLFLAILLGAAVPGTGGLREMGASERSAWILGAFFATIVFENVGTFVTRLALRGSRVSRPRRAMLVASASALAGALALAIFLSPLFETWRGSAIAAVTAVGAYLALTPWLKRQARKTPDA